MIRMLSTKTIGGQIYPAGSIVSLNAAIEAQLIASADADTNVLPSLVVQSFAAVARSSVNGAGDTAYGTLGSIVLPAGLMGPNSKLEIEASWNLTSSASTKTLELVFGGTVVAAPGLTTTSSYTLFRVVQNLNSLGAQRTPNVNGYGAGADTNTTVDTSADVAIDLRCKWSAAVASESIILVGYSIWHYPGS